MSMHPYTMWFFEDKSNYSLYIYIVTSIWSTCNIHLKHLTHIFTTYAFSATWVGGTTNWHGGGGSARRPQQARRAMAGANLHGTERATAQAGGGTLSGPFVQTDDRFIVLPLKIVHDEILAQR
jgi:hypothetical protein